MKRILAMILALLLIPAAALSEASSVYDYTQSLTPKGEVIYTFEDLSLCLPANWTGKVMPMQTDSGVSFYQVSSYREFLREGLEGGGFLFMLGACVNDSFTNLPSYEYLGFSERSAMNYYLLLPSDYPAYNDDAIRAEYDAMCGDIPQIVQSVEFFPAEAEPAPQTEPAPEATAEPAPQTETPPSGIAPAKARYQFEHSMLPRYFYDDPQNMLDVVGDVGVYTLWRSVIDENGVESVYPEADYAEHRYTAGDGTIVAQFELPEPDETTLCYRVYMVYNPQTGAAGYYTVEYDELIPGSGLVCTWDADRNHAILDGAPLFERGDAAALLAEAVRVAGLAGASGDLVPAGTEDGDTGESENLVKVSCPELGFSTLADPAYAWDYQEGTGLSIYTEHAGSIPYVIVYQSGDLIIEAYEYILEQFTPYMQKQYGDALVDYAEYEAYDIGGKQLPAGLYTYSLQGHLVQMLRLFDSTGPQTVAYTAKYLKDNPDATLAALDTAIRGYQAE